MSNFDWINETYGINACKGARVKYEDSNGKVHLGTIQKPVRQYLGIVLDGEKEIQNFHPTYNLKIIESED